MDLAQTLRHLFLLYFKRPRLGNEIYVTEAIGCPRKAFFNIRFNADPVWPNSLMIRGKLMHALLDEILKPLGNFKYEVEVTEPLNGDWILVGKADVFNPEANEVWEFKFVKGLKDRAVDVIYMSQVNTYACMLGAKSYKLILVDPRFRVEVLDGSPDRQAYEVVIDRAKMILEYVEREQIPDGPLFDFECRNCPWKVVCSRLKEEVKLDKFQEEVKEGEPVRKA